MKKDETPSGAQVAYARHRRNIDVLLAAINGKLARHKKTAAQRPTDWGLVGDLGHVEGLLKDVERFLR